MRDAAPEGDAEISAIGSAEVSLSPSPDISPLPWPYWAGEAHFNSRHLADEFQLLVTVSAFWLGPRSVLAFGKGHWDGC